MVTQERHEEVRSVVQQVDRWATAHDDVRGAVVVEMGVAPLSWAHTEPVDPGTYRVMNDGHRVVHDPDGILAALSAACQ